MRFQYSSDPIPVMSVPAKVSLSGSDVYETVSAKIDTGADISVIPETVRSRLKLTPEGAVRIRSVFAGEALEFPTYYVTLSIADCITADVEVLCLPREDCPIGRDILNRIIMHADGPAKEFELSG
ncbi:MAG: aspartyl protease family protein [Planctomycetota bacterium]